MIKHRFCLFLLLSLVLSGVKVQAEVNVCIDKNRMNLVLYDEGDTIMSFPISCGRGYGPKQKKGDLRTPEGCFQVTQILNAKDWGHDFGDGLGYIKHAYGPWFIRLSAGNGIGIHGTHDPNSMGLRASEGCIRLKNEDLEKLKPHLRRGVKVEILPDEFVVIPAPPIKPLSVKSVEKIEPNIEYRTHK